jgi:FtsP/CotA-like multicopper oxidase with cupredoxin domain
MNMHMPHPMHVHGVRFRIVERQRGADSPADVADGLIDQGYKDSVLVFPGERVKLLLAATEPGLFMYHCHNLEHEDAGMMRNFLVEAS